MQDKYGYGHTTEYDEELDIDSILFDFRQDSLHQPPENRHDPDGDGQYEYGEALDAPGLAPEDGYAYPADTGYSPAYEAYADEEPAYGSYYEEPAYGGYESSSSAYPAYGSEAAAYGRAYADYGAEDYSAGYARDYSQYAYEEQQAYVPQQEYYSEADEGYAYSGDADEGILSYEEYARLMEQRERAAHTANVDEDEDVKAYVPAKSRRQTLAEEALQYMSALDREAPPHTYAAPTVSSDEDLREYDEEARRREWEAQVREFYGRSPEESGEAAPEFDARFNLGGKRESRAYRFDGQELDLSAEEGYTPAKSRENISHWSQGEGLPQEEEEQAPRKKRPWGKRGKGKRRDSGFDEIPVAPAEEQDGYSEEFQARYAVPDRTANDAGYSFARETVAGIGLEDDFPSFKEFYMMELVKLMYKLRFSSLFAPPATYIKEDDPNLEQTVDKAYQYYNGCLGHIKSRMKLAYVLLLLMLWLNLGLPIFGALKDVRISAAMSLALQLTFMLLNVDIITGGILNIFRRRFGADSLTVIACIISSVDALAVMCDLFGSVHRPLVFMSSFSLFGVMLSALYSAKGLRKSLRVSDIAETRFSVTSEKGAKGRYDTLIKSDRGHKGFVRRCEEMPPDESLYIKLSPLILVLCLLLGAIVCFVHESWSEFVYVISALLSLGIPASALICFAMPYCMGALRIFKQGAAIAGWSGVCEIGQSESLIVTDRDLFPKSCVSIDGVSLFIRLPRERLVSYATTLIFAAQTCTVHAFVEFMDKCNKYNKEKYPSGKREECRLLSVENFEVLAGGGFKGIIDGHVVIVGSAALMKLLNIRISHKNIGPGAILLAVDDKLAAVFDVHYTPDGEVRKALTTLMRSGNHPIFAARDFNVTPQMLKELFDLPTDGYDFPPFSERFGMTDVESVNESPITAIVCREGLKPLVIATETGASVYSITRINLIISAVSAILGIVLVFLKLLTAGFIAPGFLVAFAAIFTLPVIVLSFLIKFGG